MSTDTPPNRTDDTPVALITGAGRRIGACIAEILHNQGYRVLIHYRSAQQQADELAEKLNHMRPASALTLQADLGNLTQLEQMAKNAVDSWGRLDALVNNASDFFPTAVGNTTDEQWQQLFASNLRAPYFLCQALAPSLAKQQGAIVNLVDIHAFKPLLGYPVYSSAKAGLLMLTQSMAKELAPDIRVNGVAPGLILWPEGEASQSDSDKQKLLEKTPLQHPGQPQDVASAVSFLLSQSYITGQILAVDGGKSLYS
ncbi:MAG: pteridine reductase [Motiliproteus sp.]|nr:pteridine reductase [Motiliproteus sp.]MCW9053069.1 pteridine reductase [Motiliproteus sp.]